MSRFAAELFSRLDVAETYEVAEERFDAAAIADILKQTAQLDLGPQAAMDALQAISPDLMDSSRDLQPDSIYKSLGEVFRVQKYENHEYIGLANRNDNSGANY